ncbi:hypothetical protein MTR_1113s0010 [Medicago truncatula]|uniref:Uncharacterized protein n=1 Tax=Medicago truncatula TaxID=3880 RepID=A0A072TDG0_MEDTR|nr:hypothetical protein MTR_1113s0010 [Medicago truncatula]
MKTSHDTQTQFYNTEEEDDFFSVKESNVQEYLKDCSNRLVGKFLSGCRFGVYHLLSEPSRWVLKFELSLVKSRSLNFTNILKESPL